MYDAPNKTKDKRKYSIRQRLHRAESITCIPTPFNLYATLTSHARPSSSTGKQSFPLYMTLNHAAPMTMTNDSQAPNYTLISRRKWSQPHVFEISYTTPNRTGWNIIENSWYIEMREYNAKLAKR